eukprot:3941946-Rhodomonas_salina.5
MCYGTVSTEHGVGWVLVLVPAGGAYQPFAATETYSPTIVRHVSTGHAVCPDAISVPNIAYGHTL